MLELGCASGGNLLPLGVALPGSRFVGIDLSARQVAEGQRQVEALGLNNIELRCQDLLAVDESLGRFDYVLCHGVFSWVPPEAQDKILDICAHHLAPTGVAYVSYNTYPGWRTAGTLRDLMLFHARCFSEPGMRVRQARALLDVLSRWVPGKDDPYGLLLKRQADHLRTKADCYLFHEHLESVNEPVYFTAFMERASARGLQYLADANVGTMAGDDLPVEVREALPQMTSDLLAREQYLDFFRNRAFRKTLLCHRGIALDRALGSRQITGFHVASPLRPVVSEPDVQSAAAVEFRTRAGASLTTAEPLLKAALACLSEAWPKALPFDRLLAAARSRLEAPHASGHGQGEGEARSLGAALVGCYAKGVVELSLHPGRFVREAGERPVASPLARLQAGQAQTVTNLRHEVVELTGWERHLLRRLDGSHDRGGLVDLLADSAEKGILVLQEDQKPVAEPARRRGMLAQVLEESLARLARAACW